MAGEGGIPQVRLFPFDDIDVTDDGLVVVMLQELGEPTCSTGITGGVLR